MEELRTFCDFYSDNFSKDDLEAELVGLFRKKQREKKNHLFLHHPPKFKFSSTEFNWTCLSCI